MSDPSSNLPTVGEADALPSLRTALESWLGFKLPLPPLPQTLKNLDKALARNVEARGQRAARTIERNTELEDAKSEAKLTLIKAATKGVRNSPNRADLLERALEFSLSDLLIKQTNREKIAASAAEQVLSEPPTDDAPNEIEDDWLNAFSDLSATKSNQEIQNVWAKVLSGEIKRPGSFSISTLYKLAAFDQNSAKLVHDLLANTIDGHYLPRPEKNLGVFLEGEDLGILTGSGTFLSRNVHLRGDSVIAFILFDRAVIGIFDSEREFDIPQLPLTAFGRQLYRLSKDYEPDKRTIDFLVDILKKNDVKQLFVTKIDPHTYPSEFASESLILLYERPV